MEPTHQASVFLYLVRVLVFYLVWSHQGWLVFGKCSTTSGLLYELVKRIPRIVLSVKSLKFTINVYPRCVIQRTTTHLTNKLDSTHQNHLLREVQRALTLTRWPQCSRDDATQAGRGVDSSDVTSASDELAVLEVGEEHDPPLGVPQQSRLYSLKYQYG